MMDDVAIPSVSTNPGVMVPSPKDVLQCDPYAFPSDDPVPHPTADGNYHTSKSLQLSFHSKSVLSSGHLLPQPGGLEADVDSLKLQFPPFVQSAACDVDHSKQLAPRFLPPSSESEGIGTSPTQPRHIHLKAHLLPERLSSGNEFFQHQNGASFQRKDGASDKQTKKKKQSKPVDGIVTSMMQNKAEIQSMVCAMTPLVNSGQSVLSGDTFPLEFKTHPDIVRERNRVSANPGMCASVMPDKLSREKCISPHSAQTPGTISIATFVPTTATAATFTNSIEMLPRDRRQSADSVDLPSSRPASRTSTASSCSSNAEGKNKEVAESISMSKIMEIIEREKLLGSPSPCKRRRTAKPQHIQEAEEEAKRYAAANSAQSSNSCANLADVVSVSQPSSLKTFLAGSPTVNQSVPLALPQEKAASFGERPQLSSIGTGGMDTTQVSNKPCKSEVAKLFCQNEETKQQCETEGEKQSSKNEGVKLLHPLTEPVDNKSGSTVHDTAEITHFASHMTDAVARPDISGMVRVSCTSVHIPGKCGVERQQSGDEFVPHDTDVSDIAIKQPAPASSTPDFIYAGEFEQANLRSKTENIQCTKPLSAQTSHSVVFSNDDSDFRSSVQKKSHHTHSHLKADISTKQCTPAALGSFHCDNETVFEETSKDTISSPDVPSPYDSGNSNHVPSFKSSGHNSFHQVSVPHEWQSDAQGQVTNTGQMPTQPLSELVHVRGHAEQPLEDAGNHEIWSQTESDFDSLSHHSQLTSTPVSWKPEKKVPSASLPRVVPSQRSTVSVDAVPRPKKKLSSAVVSRSSPSSVDGLSGDLSPVGTLPPFGAFAELKTEVVHPFSGCVPKGLHEQLCVQPKSNTGVKQSPNGQRAKHSRSLTTLAGCDRVNKEYIKGSIVQEPLRDHSNLKSVGSTIKNELGASNVHQNIKSSSNVNTLNVKLDPSSRPACGSRGALSIDSVSNPYLLSNHVLETRPGSSVSANPKPHTDSKVVNNKMDSAYSSNSKQVVPLNKHGMKTLNDYHVTHFHPHKSVHGKTQESLTPGTRVARIEASPCSRSQQTGAGHNSKGLHETFTMIQNNAFSAQGVQSTNCLSLVTAPPAVLNGVSAPLQTQTRYSKTEVITSPSVEGSQVPLRSDSTIDGKGTSSKVVIPSVYEENMKPDLLQYALNKEHKEHASVQRASCVRTGCDDAGNKYYSGPAVGGGLPLIADRKVKLGDQRMLNGEAPHFKNTPPQRRSPAAKPAGSTTPKLEPRTDFSSPEEELDDRLRNNRTESVPKCGCLGPDYEFNESIEGPFYTQLGTAKDVPGLRNLMEKRTGLNGNAIRIEKIHYTGKEGRTQEGCPMAKWIIRRSSPEEKYLCVARKRPGHFCDTAYIVVAIVAWEGVASQQADSLYGYLVSTLTKYGFETDRRCGTNESKTCACQGVDLIRRGASFSFGCSWSMYFNGCKFARSNIARKFKLKDTSEEEKIEEHLQELATRVGPLYEVIAPDAYRNQTHFESQASMCRLGKEKGKPFSGVTACVDFCAHSHKDFHNMQNGSTVVVTLTKHRGLSKPDDEQLHVLPLYVLDNTDEHGSISGQMDKVRTGALEILHKYSVQARMRATPVKKPKRGAKKESPAKANASVNTSSVTSSAQGAPSTISTPPKEKDSSFLHSQDSSQSLPDSYTSGNSSSAMHTPEKKSDGSFSSFVEGEHSFTAGDITSQDFAPAQMYEKVWEYFYANGVFPPSSCMEQWAAAQKQALMNPKSASMINGARNNGSNTVSSHQSSHHHSLQAADSQQHSSLFNTQHSYPPNCQPVADGFKGEDTNQPCFDQEIVHLTHSRDNSDQTLGSPHPTPSPGLGDKGNCARTAWGQSPSRPQSINSGNGRTPNSKYTTPLDMLTEAAASLEAGRVGDRLPPSSPACPPQFASTPFAASSQPATCSSVPPSSPGECNGSSDVMYPPPPLPHSTPDAHEKGCGNSFVSPKPSCDGTSGPTSHSVGQPHVSTQHVLGHSEAFVAPTLGQGPDEPTFTMIDPTVVRYEWQDNTENFHDPGIGGVAIALSHGAVLFEVAKRELHATTALKNPNRFQPTRISLVFYQHKNLNYFHHGYYEHERKMATQRENRIRKLMEEGATAAEAERAVKPGRKRKKKETEEEEEEKIDFAKTSAAQYRYMWDTTVRHGTSLTTDSIITRWIDPQPMVSGPYQRWV